MYVSLGIPRAMCAALVLVVAVGCDSSGIEGRYYQGRAWLDFRHGVVTHGELGEYVSYKVEGKKVTLFDKTGSIEGEWVNPTTLRFAIGTGAMAEAFAGEWVLRERSSNDALNDTASQEAAKALVGQWRIPGETHVFEFRTDGSFTWGPRLSGSYQMLQGKKVRITLFEDGKQLNDGIDHDYATDGKMLTLTMPGDRPTTYERVK